MKSITDETTKTSKNSLGTHYGMNDNHNPLFDLSVDLFRSTPVEALHSLLLGCCKYMLREFMEHRSSKEKKEILARVKSFPYCGFSTRITGNICYYYKSFVGRDFKAWMQMALFIIPLYLSDSEKNCWFQLSKMNTRSAAYSLYLQLLNTCLSTLKD